MSLHRFLRRTGQANVGNKLYMNPNRTAGKPIRMSLYSLTRVGGEEEEKGCGMWRGKLLFQRMTLLVGNVSFTPFEEIDSPTKHITLLSHYDVTFSKSDYINFQSNTERQHFFDKILNFYTPRHELNKL